MCPFGRRLAPVARQHGRYEPEGQFYRRDLAVAFARLVLLVSLLALCFFCRCQALTPCIMAGTDQITRCFIKVIYIPVVAQRLSPWSRFPVAVQLVVDVPGMLFNFPVVAQRHFPSSRLFCGQ